MKLKLSVSGMTCGGCEMHVEKAAMENNSVSAAKADNSRGTLIITLSESYDNGNEKDLLDDLEQRIESAGYKLEGLYKADNGNFSIKQWVGLIIIMAALFLIVKETGIMNRLPVIESTMGYGLIFIIGLMTSVHCIGMCGGINLTVSLSAVKLNNKEAGTFHRARPAILYNAGRVVSYTLVGALVGALGSVISITGNIQGFIVGIAGVFMMLMGIKMLGLFPGISKILPRLPKRLSSKIISSGSGKGPFIIGFLNGFMPCGPLQSVQIYALGTGSAIAGALSMFLFSLGTVPLMLGFGSISSILSPKFHGRILKVSALLVLMLGGGMVLRGMSLNGVAIMGARSFNDSSENVRIAEIQDDKQYVRTIMHGDEYEPFIVEAGIPVVWTIFADKSELNGCNNPLTVPEYGIRFEMSPGENIIEFTPPAEESTITYTCWMGMITSGIKVVADLDNIDRSLISDTAALADESGGGCSGGSCSGEGGGGCGGAGEYADPDLKTFSMESLPHINIESVGLPQLEEGIQIVKVNVNENGFEPAIIVMERGLETIWMINGEMLDEKNYRLSFPAYGNRGIELSEGINSLKIVPETAFAYFSWQKDFGGYVHVVDDMNSVNIENIKADVQAYNVRNNY